MKKVYLMLAVLLISTAAHADTTANAKYNGVSPYYNNYLNSSNIIGHTHDVDKQKKYNYGLGLDVVLYENELLEVKSENKYNMAKYEGESYLVTKFNLFRKVKRMLK